MKTRRAKAEAPPEPTYSIQNCNFAGVQWDAKAVEAVQTVAEALLNLTRLFRSQDVNIETMIKVAAPGVTIADSKMSPGK